MMITTPPAEPVVYLVLRDEILFFHFHPVICRKSFLFQEQIIKLIPQFLFGHDRTETQLLFPHFKLVQCLIHVRSCHIHTLWCR